MTEQLKALYLLETESARLDFHQDPDYQKYYTQLSVLWEGGDIPVPLLHLLDASNSLAFAHGFRLGTQLAGWKGSPLVGELAREA